MEDTNCCRIASNVPLQEERQDLPPAGPAKTTGAGIPKVVAVIQARMGSVRLPGKSLMEIAGRPLIWYVIERVKQAQEIHSVILATSARSENDPLCEVAAGCGISIYRGSETDVLSRFVEAGKATGASIIVRICADNPLVDPGEIDRIVRNHKTGGCDYSFNHVPDGTNNYPDGFGAEVVDAELLYQIATLPLSASEREHVTLHLLKNPDRYRIRSCHAPPAIIGPDIKLDIDTPEDFARMKGFMESLPAERRPCWTAVEIVQAYRTFFLKRAIVLIQNAAEARQYSSLFKGSSESIVPLALSPDAWWEFEKTGVSCLLVQDYFNPQEIYATGLENYRKLESFVETSDAALKTLFPELQSYDINLVHNNYDQIKIVLDNFTTKIDILWELIRKEKPSIIISLIDPQQQTIRDICSLLERIPYYSLLLKDHHFPVRYAEVAIAYPQVMGRKCEERRNLFLQNPLFSFPGVFELLHLVKRRGLSYGLFHLPSFLSWIILNRRYLLFTGYGYDWNELLESLYKKGFSTIHLFEKLGYSRDLTIDQSVIRILDGSGFIHRTIDYSAAIIPIISEFICRDNLVFRNNIGLINEKIHRYRPMMLICSTKSSAFEHIAAQVARSNNIPVINWQHGAYAMHLAPYVLHSELMNSDLQLCWGDEVKKYIETEKLNYHPCEIIPVGSMQLEHAYSDEKPDYSEKKHFLYITTTYLNDALFYVSCPYPWADNSLWISQKKIITVLGKTCASSIIKIHPSCKHDSNIPDYINVNGYQNIKVIKREMMTLDLVKSSDIIIIDYPTTTLLQALTTKCVVFVSTEHLQLTPTALNLLKKRAYCYDRTDDLIENLSRYINGSHPAGQDPDVNNGEYLAAYGIYRPDGRVADRVLTILEKTKG